MLIAKQKASSLHKRYSSRIANSDSEDCADISHSRIRLLCLRETLGLMRHNGFHYDAM
jgi:hypothetical protein